MDRRTLLIGLGGMAAWLSIGGCARILPMDRRPGPGDTDAPALSLSAQLAELADPQFSDYSAGWSLSALRSEMARKGVISTRHGINYEKLTELTRREPLMVYKGFYYTQTELELYALAYLHAGASASIRAIEEQ
ncbi:hypothetical protein [Marinobacter caseinilyticus]|uniref:hypothetical protein n=1 Tax=Marinobacter caseinilyticus TaxID=2692195 RepID=UPI00140CA077|nr:hypothetical protein [Marinobacter caseinilyticus]